MFYSTVGVASYHVVFGYSTRARSLILDRLILGSSILDQTFDVLQYNVEA